MATVESFNPGLHSDPDGPPSQCADAGCSTVPEFTVASDGRAVAACSRHLARAVRSLEGMSEPA